MIESSLTYQTLTYLNSLKFGSNHMRVTILEIILIKKNVSKTNLEHIQFPVLLLELEQFWSLFMLYDWPSSQSPNVITYLTTGIGELNKCHITITSELPP